MNPCHARHKTTSTLRNSLKIAANEKDVENGYRAAFDNTFPSKTRSPFKVDGLLECDDVRSLLEFKYKVDLRLKVEQCGVLIQTLFYMKQFANSGKEMPTTIFVGDDSECFCMSSNVLEKYLDQQIDWTVAPSGAKNKHPAVLQALVDDQDILPFVFDINGKSFDFGEVVDQVRELGKGVVVRIKITKDNVVEIFNDWRKRVLIDERYDHKADIFGDKADTDLRDITTRQSDIFFACLTDKENTYLKPTKKNTLVSRGEDVKVNGDQHKAFFSRFSQILSPSELDVLVANKDRIIEEVTRRRTGAFFTPTLWVAEAHRMLGEALGVGWREEYVVWDCASGTNNLTRDFKFKELYCSTLDKGDVDTVKDMGYNPGSKCFQYDFLNDDEVDTLGSKVPEGLRKAFADGRKVLFLINPPYGTANELGAIATHGKHKGGIAQTKINQTMKQDGMGKSSQQLYAQFLYRIAKLQKNANLAVGIFCPPLLMSGGSLDIIRSLWYDNFSFKTGMLFQASNFADVAGQWGIGFTVWAHGKQKEHPILNVCELNTDTFQVKKVSSKTVYSAEDQGASDWVRELGGVEGAIDAPQLGSSVTVKNEGRGRLVKDSLAYMTNVSNNIYKNGDGVFLTSSCSSMAHGLSVLPANFRRCIALFTARKTIQPDWINCKDEYLVPHAASKDSPLNARYEQWVNDALVYALFNTSSQQSSLRDVQYKGKTWQIKNHFFFMPAKEMKELADQAGFQEMYADAKVYGDDSFVFKQLASLTLSDDAKAVLEAAKSLVRASMGMRKAWHADHPEANLQAWDAGWAQLKPCLKACHKGLYDQFVTTYKAFERRMTKGVYEFGFLK